MDNNNTGSYQISPSFKMPNGYIVPEGKLIPHTLFVGGIDLKVDEYELRDFFARYGAVKEVKIITYRVGVSKGYGFIQFNEDVNIQSIIEQQISFKGRRLKLGPAILQERKPARSVSSHLVGPARWMSPTQYYYCACCLPVGGAMAQPSPMINEGNPYNQLYTYSNFMIPQVLMNYYGAQNAYAYQDYIYCYPLFDGWSLSPNMQYPPLHWMADERTWHVIQSCLDCGMQPM